MKRSGFLLRNSKHLHERKHEIIDEEKQPAEILRCEMS